MSVFKRGGYYWYEFHFAGSRIRESSKSTSRNIARMAERTRRRELEESFNRIKKPRTALMFALAAEEWLESKKAHLAPRSVAIERANLKHLNPVFGKHLVCDVSADDVSAYQAARLQEGASPKTVNLEVGTLRAILRRNRLWAEIQPDVRMLRAAEDVGRAISTDEENTLLKACRNSRSRSLYPAVTMALNTCMRYSELRLLRWVQVDFVNRSLTVGRSKTEAGTGRVIPLNDSAIAILSHWANLFPERQPEHYVFPAERYGAAGDGWKVPLIYASNPAQPIGRWKEAWEAAKIRAGVQCRFHDLRHTGCTRMLEAGVPFSVVATVMGWSTSTTVRMAKRYGHIGQAAQRQAVATLSGGSFEEQYPQNHPHSGNAETRTRAN
jgi:integrase